MSEGSCPNGGQWYTCNDQSAFFGCCTSNPCNGSGCPLGDLRAAGMGSGSGPDSPLNDGSPWPNEQCAYGQWWTCADQTPSFQGCCLTDPCQGDGTGCPDGQLFPAAFASVTSSPTTSSLSSRSTSSSDSSSSTASSSPSSNTTALTVSPTSSPTSTPTPAASASLTHAQVRAIAGGSAGASVFLFLVLALLFSWWRAKQSRKAHISQPPLRPAPSLFPENIQPKMSQTQPQPTPRTPLPSLQTDLSNTYTKQRTYSANSASSAYSAYSPDHITPSSFDSHHSPSPFSATDNLVNKNTHARAYSEESHYPGRPIFGVPHPIKSPAPVAQAPLSRRSLGSDGNSQGPSPPPPYKSQPHSPISPTTPTTGRRASYANYSYLTHPDPPGRGITVPLAAVGARGAGGERRASAQGCERRPTVRQVRSDGGMGAYEPRRRSAPERPLYENPYENTDCVPELPNNPTNLDPRRERRRPAGAQSLRIRTLSGSAGDGSRSVAEGGGGWGDNETVQSINAASRVGGGWGGDMRTNRERQRDMEKERDAERQRIARMSYASWQNLSP